MKLDAEEQRDEALSFLLNHEVGTLATVSKDGTPRARLVYYTCDDAFNIYFLTMKNTRKVADLESNAAAAFVVSEARVPRTIQIEGKVADVTDDHSLGALTTAFFRQLSSEERPYRIPLTRLDAGSFAFYRLTPTSVRWGDYASGERTEEVLVEIETAEPKP